LVLRSPCTAPIGNDEDMQTPLDGIRVLDFTRVLAGPHCTRMFADLGAEVIKIEPPAGDVTRFTSPRRNSMPTYYAQQNSGKRSLSLDLRRPEAVELMLKLAEQCDIVIENYRPGVMDRFGLSYEAISARNQRIIYASINGYGSTGPWSNRRAYAPVVQAEVGLTKSQGDHGGGGVYRNDRHSHADVYTSLDAAAGVLAALYQRERTGRGQWIDIAMAQVMLYVNEHVHDELWEGHDDPNWVRSFGNEYQPVVELGNGDHVIIAGHPAAAGNFEMYIGAIDRMELEEDPRFATPASRQVHLDDLIGYIRDYALTVPDAEAMEAQCSKFRLAVGAIRSVADVCDSEWARQRDVIREVDDRGGGTYRIPNAPWKFSDAPDVGVKGGPRYRGEDNAEVLSELLGLQPDEIAALAEAGVLSHHLPRQR
jgi:crotonobetainyl-CoA:carnitine CoA-transferase CaiB-like acyl-CoA transferase